MSTRIRPPWPLWHPSSIPLEEFKRMLADAAKHPITSTHDIDYLMDSVSASRGKTLRTVPVSMILDVSSILFEYASHKTWCMKAFRALDAFPHPINCLWSIRHICDDIVETLQKRLTIDHASVDKKEYLDNFLDCIPDQLGGYEGIWRIIFSYHYSSDEENYNVIKKGFKVMTVFAFYYPIDLGM